MIFRRIFLRFKVILAYCLLHVFAFDLILQEKSDRTGEFRRKKFQLNDQFADIGKIRTDKV